MNQVAMEIVLQHSMNRVLDFGPPLPYQTLCTAYTVQRVSLWEHTTPDKFELVAVQAAFMHKARAQGNMYNVSDEELFALDSRRGHGVHSERKWMAVYVSVDEPNPPYGTIPKMIQTYAWVYIGKTDHWVATIEEGAADKLYVDGVPLPKAPDFHLVNRYPHPNPTLNGRFCFLPPSYDQGRVSTMTPRMRKKIRKANKAFARDLWFKFRRFVGQDDGEHTIYQRLPSSQDIKGLIP